MWDNAPLLRGITGVLVSISVLAMLYGAVHYTVHRPDVLPLHRVNLTAAPERVDTLVLRQVLSKEIEGNFFTVDLEQLRQTLEKLPWVRNVSIRREFPDRLELQLEEHQPLARWNRNELVNIHGEVFQAESAMELPDFTGSTGDASKIVERYTEFGHELAKLNLRIAKVILTPRHAWRLELDNGIVVELGYEEMSQRLGRFVAGYPYIRAASDTQSAAGGSPVKRVDLRYRNGFAIGI